MPFNHQYIVFLLFMIELKPQPQQCIYFASDFHLGVDAKHNSKRREQEIVKWLEKCRKDAHAIFLVGDLFDFWFEYKQTIPKGYTRFLGKLAELSDDGIQIHIFTGNHDLWMFGYLEKELGAKVYREPQQLKINDVLIWIGHGDGIGPGDKGYKFLKRIFTNPFYQWLFQWMHPNIGIGLAHFWSGKSRAQANNHEQKFLGDDEWIWSYCKTMQQKQPYHYYIFGHRHLPLTLDVPPGGTYINLGEWLHSYSYAVYENGEIKLEYWDAS